MSACNCSEAQKPDELLVSCDGLSSVPDVKYQLEGIPANEIKELAILRTKNLEAFRPGFFDGMHKLTRLSLAANPKSNIRLPLGIFDQVGDTLETLDLSTSSLTEMDLNPDVFAPLTRLRVWLLNFDCLFNLIRKYPQLYTFYVGT